MYDKDIEYSDKPRYHIIDKRTGRSIASYTNKNRARNEVDKRDNAHGAYIHHIEERSPNPEIKPKRVL